MQGRQPSRRSSIFSPRRSQMDGDTPLPMHNRRNSGEGNNTTGFRSRWVHIIPVIVLLCLFILWWFSSPVKLEMENGRIVAAHQVKMMQNITSSHDQFRASNTTL